MNSRLSSIEENTGKNTRTLKQMDDKLTSLTSRVITVENEITSVKTRVSDVNISELNVFVNVHFIVQEISQ
jgi:predicted  nucleic acid-binding Zn-ribbon protein